MTQPEPTAAHALRMFDPQTMSGTRHGEQAGAEFTEHRRTLTEAARERLLAEMSGGMKPCLWCIGVPVFDSRDDLLAHIHELHLPADLRQRLKATSNASNAYANQLFAIRLLAADGIDPARVIAAVNALHPTPEDAP